MASCDTGWKVSDDESTCAANVCSCTNGVRASGAKCASDGAKVCESCNSGFKLRSDNTACDGKVGVSVLNRHVLNSRWFTYSAST